MRFDDLVDRCGRDVGTTKFIEIPCIIEEYTKIGRETDIKRRSKGEWTPETSGCVKTMRLINRMKNMNRMREARDERHLFRFSKGYTTSETRIITINKTDLKEMSSVKKRRLDI